MSPDGDASGFLELLKSYRERREAGLCPHCGRDPKDFPCFRDNVSEIEYKISGLCQNCQDLFFNQIGDIRPIEQSCNCAACLARVVGDGERG